MPSNALHKFTGLGEGRSKSIYIEATLHDTAVLIAFYNPARFKRILTNALYVINMLNEKKIPVFIIECVFHKNKQQIPNATLVVKSNSYMFYKEQLLNKLETIVPEKYTKLVFLDADVIFDTPDWVDQISTSLEKYDVIQPFSQSCWLTPDNTRIYSKKNSYAHAIIRKMPINKATVHDYHPGFAWAMKRDIFRKIGGFFPRSIIGGGDVTFVLNLFPFKLSDDFFYYIVDQNFGKFIIEAWREYNANFKTVNPRLGYLSNRAFHLFHGVKEHRQYVSRYQDIYNVLKGTWNDEINVNSDGLFEFKRPEDNSIVLKYFKSRNEDIPISQAKNIIRSRSKARNRSSRALLTRKHRAANPVNNTVNNTENDTLINTPL